MRIALLSLLLVTLASLNFGQPPMESVSRKVNKILLKKDLKVLAAEMAASPATDVESILMRMDVFRRTGDTARMRDALFRLPDAPDLPKEVERKKSMLGFVRGYVRQDLALYRFYYEKLGPDDDIQHAEDFVSVWEREGDPKELDAWLSQRAVRRTIWYKVDLNRRLRLDNAQPILDDLAEKVRNDRADAQALSEYLGTVAHAQSHTVRSHPGRYDNETNWLGDFLQPQGAVATYNAGEMLMRVNPRLAIKYFLQSLKTPVTPEDIAWMEKKHRIYLSVGTVPPRDWEKQLRYWTKEKLASAYQTTGQSVLAQPLVEELVATKGDDIWRKEINSLAGAVQSGSGARVVESKVVQDEATRFQTQEYWRERIEYYIGRKEGATVVDSFGNGLKRIPSKSKSSFISWFSYRFQHDLNRMDNYVLLKERLGEILLEQFNSVKSDSDFAFDVVEAATPQYLGADSFMRELFVQRRDVFVPVMSTRRGYKRHDLIRYILSPEGRVAEHREYYLDQLERIVANEPPENLLGMVDVLINLREYRREILFLQKYLSKLLPAEKENEIVIRGPILNLFNAHCNTGQWQIAEKLMEENQSIFLEGLGGSLRRLALTAAESNAPDDAFRLWLKSVNFTGHSLNVLHDINNTSTKPLLVQYYRKMKQEDPNSVVADNALKFLLVRNN